MNPLQILYDTVDILKDGKNGKVSLIYDKVSKQVYVMKERNLKTAEIYERLQNIKSPYLPEIYRTLEFDSKFFIVEEFIKGRTLLEILTYDKKIDEEKAAQILKQLCKVLKILHEQKIIHRDIKPSNIMVTENNSVKLIDFSISRIEKENQDADTDFLGTKGYAPPEQFGFGQTDARSDIYSLGVTIQKILGENYNGYLKKILLKCSELDPAKRYKNVDEIVADIDREIAAGIEAKKIFRYRIKKAAVTISATCAMSFLTFMDVKNFPADEKISVPPVKVEETKIEKTPLEKVQPRTAPKEFEWAEIKMPESENFEPPINSTPPLSEIDTFQDENATDPRLNQVCTLNLNGAIYHSGDGEISADVWKNWKSDGENIYLPQNFSVSLNLENKNPASLNLSVTANLNGLQKSEKVFSATIAADTSKIFEIPLGGLACNNGKFEVEIWLKENNGSPLFGIWNGENFNNHGTIIIYLTDYNKRRTQKKFRIVF